MGYDNIREEVAEACNILGTQGFEEFGFPGHVSARIPKENKFAVLGHLHHEKPGKGMGDATKDDIIIVDLNGKKVEGELHPVGELIIHTSIYRARKDVGAVVHCHPPTIVAFSTTEAKVLPINVIYMAGPVDGISYLDLGARLITTERDGERLVRSLRKGSMVIQRGHGAVAVGRRVQEAVINMIFVEKSLRLQSAAQNFGGSIGFNGIKSNYGDERREDIIDDSYNYFKRRVKVNKES